MSDFDKEAEREKLREKYERDKADREATQHMSDLLLKGATMTNTHCGVCGDPLFQQDGTTFCPSCHGGPSAVEGQGGVPQRGGENAGAGSASSPGDSGAAGGDAANNRADAETPTATRSSNSSESPANDRTHADRATDSSGTQIDVSSPSGDSQSSESNRDSTPTEGSDETVPSQSGANAANAEANVDRSPSTPATARSSGDLADTRAALRGTLEYFSQEAARTDDPRYAKECLEAAREAAETLSALR